VTLTLAVAVWPEQIVFAPHAADAGVTTSVPKIGAGLTVTLACACTPTWSVAVMVTAVGAVTLPGSNAIVPVLTDPPNGRTCVSLETTKYGGTPPVTVNVVGVLEYAVKAAGMIRTGPGGTGFGAKGLFGAPLPPPQPPRSASAASASVASAGRSQRTFKRLGTMSEFLMILS
jgi:hypothetical protein